jgi:two-component system, response regulator, stage 0 sporulation protein F
MDKPVLLYVDDERVNLQLFKAILDETYTVLTASNGKSGLEIISTNKDVKVVFSDMRMPNMNGIEFIKQAIAIAPHISYYILTGYDITTEIKEAIAAGTIRKYFSKPLNMDEIIAEIEEVLKDKGTH